MGESFRFWIIPCIALIFVIVILGGLIEYKINTIMPNAEIELQEIKKMSCEQVTARNALGSYWTPKNGAFARDKVKDCIDADKVYKEKLRDIRTVGTHEEKLKVGFTKLWFGVYDHPDLAFLKTKSIIPIPLGTIKNKELYPSEITVIAGYNSTIVFQNEDRVMFWIEPDFYGNFTGGVIQPSEELIVNFVKPGEYGFHSHPWLRGTITVLDLLR